MDLEKMLMFCDRARGGSHEESSDGGSTSGDEGRMEEADMCKG